MNIQKHYKSVESVTNVGSVDSASSTDRSEI